MRTNREQIRKPEAELIKEAMLMDGPNYFPNKHPDMECVLVIKRLPGSTTFQKFSDVPTFKTKGYQVLSEDEADTGDSDYVWMGMPKEKFRALTPRTPELDKKPRLERIGDSSVYRNEKGFKLEEMEGMIESEEERTAKVNQIEKSGQLNDFFQELQKS